MHTPVIAGSRVLRQLLAAGEEAACLRSEAEERLLALLRRAQLPAPAHERAGAWS